jgi:hypothetical protein
MDGNAEVYPRLDASLSKGSEFRSVFRIKEAGFKGSEPRLKNIKPSEPHRLNPIGEVEHLSLNAP